jgi:integrase
MRLAGGAPGAARGSGGCPWPGASGWWASGCGAGTSFAREVPIFDPVLRLVMEDHWNGRDPEECLLHPGALDPEPIRPSRRGPRDALAQPDQDALRHRDAHVVGATPPPSWRSTPPDARPSAHRAARVWRATGDLELIRQLAGHKSIQTTADIYVHSNGHDLERGLRAALDPKDRQ